MSAPSLLLVRMDVAHDREATVNQMYEQEHLPPILEVPGVRRITRYRQPAPTSPRYMTAAEVDSPAVIDSAAWRTAVDLGRWPREWRRWRVRFPLRSDRGSFAGFRVPA